MKQMRQVAGTQSSCRSPRPHKSAICSGPPYDPTSVTRPVFCQPSAVDLREHLACCVSWGSSPTAQCTPHRASRVKSSSISCRRTRLPVAKSGNVAPCTQFRIATARAFTSPVLLRLTLRKYGVRVSPTSPCAAQPDASAMPCAGPGLDALCREQLRGGTKNRKLHFRPAGLFSVLRRGVYLRKPSRCERESALMIGDLAQFATGSPCC